MSSILSTYVEQWLFCSYIIQKVKCICIVNCINYFSQQHIMSNHSYTFSIRAWTNSSHNINYFCTCMQVYMENGESLLPYSYTTRLWNFGWLIQGSQKHMFLSIKFVQHIRYWSFHTTHMITVFVTSEIISL